MDSVENMDRLELLKQLGLIEPNNNLDAQATMFALRDYKNVQVYEAYAFHKTVSPYPMKVCEVVEYWKKKKGETPEALEQKAALIYEEFFKHPKTGYDHVADKRIVYAFKVAFGSFIEYGNRTDYIEGIDKKDFIKAYVNARPEDYQFSSNVIPGLYHYNTNPDPRVICIGEQVKALAREIYGNKVVIENYVTYKRPPQLEVKKEDKKELTPEEKKAMLDKVQKAIEELTNMMKPRRC